jgi:hypothetical protein
VSDFIHVCTVEIYRAPRSIYQNRYYNESVAIAVQNDALIVLNDRSFSKVAKSKDYDRIYPRLNKPSVNIRVDGGLFEPGIFYTLYSESKRKAEKVRREIDEEIKEKYGWIYSSTDLSIIKD